MSVSYVLFSYSRVCGWLVIIFYKESNASLKKAEFHYKNTVKNDVMIKV